MKIYYIDRKIQIKHLTDLSILSGIAPVSQCGLKIPAKEDFVIQLAALPESEAEIKKISFEGALPAFCINTEITDKFGKSFAKKIVLTKNSIQPLFFIIPASSENIGKTEKLTAIIKTDCGEERIDFDIIFTDEDVENSGYNDITRLSRLSWLNSSAFLNSGITEPYTEPIVNGNTVKILGRDIIFAENGLPEQVGLYYDEGINIKPEVQKYLFEQPMRFAVCENMKWGGVSSEQDRGTVIIRSSGESKNLRIETQGRLSYEGALSYSIKLTALADAEAENISLSAFLSDGCADYMNGLGAVGGFAEDLDFRWTAEKHHDCLYVGSVNAGLRIKWKAENYKKPLINIYYKNQPLVVPEETWSNRGAGKISFKNNVICAETGKFKMAKGEERHFDFEIHITPLKPIDYKKHFSVRYSHNNNLKDEFKEVDRAAELGLNYVVVHHGNPVHPFINYPFIETERLKALVEYAKTKNIGVKVYYTVREHSNHMAEVFAYKALGDEIIMRKKGKGYSWQGGTAKWLTEYFGDEIIPAWQVIYDSGKYKNDPDVSFIVHPDSRLDNYYIEGLDWLVKNMGIKGIYIDDTALDRTTLERAKKVLSQTQGLIDMHMWNHEEDRAGDVSCMNLYTELFPFIDSLWIGESYPYKKLAPEYILTEVSGIPYGQTSRMLEGGGNPYIGMLYAMNNRYGWGAYNAVHIYSLWDSFGIEESEMRGYWHSRNPVSTDCDSVKTTVYVKDDCALVCMFNFSDKKVKTNITIDEEKLGFKPGAAKRAYIKKLQREKRMNPAKEVKLKAKSGVIFVVTK